MGSIERMFNFFAPTVFTQQKNSKLYKLLKSFAEEFDNVDTALDVLKKVFQIDTATGDDLEKIAKLFNLYRSEGESDESLRARIVAFWAGALGCGTLQSIKNALQQFSADLEVSDMPLALRFKITGEAEPELVERIAQVIRAMKPVGVAFFQDVGIVMSEEAEITDEEFVELLTTIYFITELHKTESNARVDILSDDLRQYFIIDETSFYDSKIIAR